MTPLKNGAIINLLTHDAALRCDVYKLVGYGWLFRVTNHFLPTPDDPDFIITDYDRWFDEEGHAPFGTMLVKERMANATDKFHEYVCAGGAHLNQRMK